MSFWVIGGSFSSLNFHRLEGDGIVVGPFNIRPEAEREWKRLSEKHRHEASYRFVIAEE